MLVHPLRLRGRGRFLTPQNHHPHHSKHSKHPWKSFLWVFLLWTVGLLMGSRCTTDLLGGENTPPEIKVDRLREITIHAGGRQQPLDTYATTVLLQISSRSSIKGETAISWFCRLLFNPVSTSDEEVFRVIHPEVLDAIGLQRNQKTKRRYSFNELAPALQEIRRLCGNIEQKESNKQNIVEKELLRLHQNILTYIFFSGSLSFAQASEHPALNDPKIRSILKIDNTSAATYPTYWELYSQHHPDYLSLVIHYSSMDTNRLSDPQWQLLSFLEKYFRFTDAAKGRNFLRIVPMSHPSTSTDLQWFSPWQVLLHTPFTNQSKSLSFQIIQSLHTAAKAYMQQNQTLFDRAIQDFYKLTTKAMGPSYPNGNMKKEVFYNKLAPFTKTKILYLLTFLSCMISFVGFHRFLGKLSWGLLLLGMGMHITGMGMRMGLTGRPPITNLYETFLFVSLVTVAMGVVVERLYRSKIGLLAGSFGGLIFLLISTRFLSEGDTMGVLIAVLRSNFWLSTHVIAINLGYGGIIFSGIIGHSYLIRYLWQGRHPSVSSSAETLKQNRHLFQLVMGTQGFGLIFTFTGTILGGIWADQSWGRFWGWDPKENGALLIVLWSAILFHGRMAGLLSSIGFAAGTCINIIVVMLAWFGINLLGIGLHSYGFTSGLAVGLFTYIGLQMFFLCLLLYFIFKNKSSQKKPLKPPFF